MWQPGIFYDTKGAAGAYRMRPYKGNAVGADSYPPWPSAALHHNKTEKTMIHQYKLSGYNIVLDVYSGSVHAVDDVAYDAIA